MRHIEISASEKLLEYMDKGLEIDDEVYFDLRSFFGVKDIATRGIRPFSF